MGDYTSTLPHKIDIHRSQEPGDYSWPTGETGKTTEECSVGFENLKDLRLSSHHFAGKECVDIITV